MSYFEDVNIKWQDSPNVDAFGRARVSQLTSQLDLKQLHDNLPFFYDTELIGTATSTYTEEEAESALETAASSDAVIMQSKQRSNYQSGKSHLIFQTFNSFHAQTNVTKRVGYFTHINSASPYDTSKDGLFLESDDTTVSVNIWQTGVETETTAQADWNIDTLDGNGESGINIDWEKNVILCIDFEWLGLGRVRWCLVVNGAIIPFHESIHTNQTAAGVYMSSPNQPLRAEVRQSGAGAGRLNYICATVASEGSINDLGVIRSYNLGTTTIDANSISDKYALLGIRLQSGKADTLIDLIDLSVLGTTNDRYLVEIWLNPTVAGTFTYASETDSSVQIAEGDSTSGGASDTTVTGGTLLYSQYISNQTATPISLNNAIRLGMDIDFTVDEMVLTAQPFTTNLDVTGSLTWREVL